MVSHPKEKYTESYDAFRTYGRYLNALSRLHWMHGSAQGGSPSSPTQPLSRLPAGSCRSCHCDKVKNEQLCGNDLPGPFRTNRPTYIVFDEVDPIAALEESFEFTADSASKDTVFVQHKTTQTDDRILFSPSFLMIKGDSLDPVNNPAGNLSEHSVVRKDSDKVNQRNSTEEQSNTQEDKVTRVTQDDGDEIRMPLSEFYYTSANSKRPIKKPDTAKGSQRAGASLDTPKKSHIFGSHKHFVEHIRFLKRPLITVRSASRKNENNRQDSKPKEEMETYEKKRPSYDKETQYELYEMDEKPCRRCDIIPMLGHQLSRMRFTIERLEAQLGELKNDVDALKRKRRREAQESAQTHTYIKPDRNQSLDRFVVIKASSLTPPVKTQNGLKIIKIPKMQPDSEISYIDTTNCKTNAAREPTANRMPTHRTSCIRVCEQNTSELLGPKELKGIWPHDKENSIDIKLPANTNTSTETFTPYTWARNKPTVQETNYNIQREHKKPFLVQTKSNTNSSTDSKKATTFKQSHQGNPIIIVHNYKAKTSSEAAELPRVQPKSHNQLESQPSSVCQFCSNKVQRVLDDLVGALVKVIGDRPYKSILLSILLRSDNVYHVNVQVRETMHVLGCLLVNHAAIEEAIKRGIFKEILTYSVIDVRNTIKPIGPPIGIPFEFIAKPRNNAHNDTKKDESANIEDLRTQAFITKVLGVPADKISKNVK
ncbi:uncharacterized protein LOC135426298 [Drosophila montana]|uniref:uncharacterized protein LOC135426298 n=1 Tax=Drosophila montana TaxID=40370 RepID=UPI00313E4D0A